MSNSFLILLINLSLLLFTPSIKSERIEITPSPESSDLVINPDQGFYRPLMVTVTPSNVVYGQENPDSIYHLRTDISAFSAAVNGQADKELTDAALSGIDKLFQKIRSEGKNAIIRFSYDPGFAGNADKECDISMIKTHIKQLSQVLNKYPDVLTAIEAGMIGRWSEMHSSKIVTAENIQIIVDAWLDNTKKIPILVRQPKFMYYFCDGAQSINEVEDITFKPSDKGYWLGMFNDGMFGDQSDLGTWNQDRKREMKWVAKQNEHLPYGGEATTGGDTSVALMKNSIPEMFGNHINYLNILFNAEVFNGWKKETYSSSIAGHKVFDGKSAFDFIYAHFGYRLVISGIIADISGGKMKINIKIDNNGFGYVNKVKKIGVAFSYDDSKAVKEFNGLGEYIGKQDEIEVEVDMLESAKEDYAVYLRLYYDIQDGDVKYPIKFANEDIYNSKIKGNFLFKVSKNNDEVYN